MGPYLHPDLQDTQRSNRADGLQRGIKRDIAAYPSLKDERYFDAFKRSLFIVAKSHECNEVLDPTYTPGTEPEDQELSEANQTVMFSVFNSNLQTDMGNNRILPKVQKSFWSCTHVNSFQKYALSINLHMLLNILS